MTTTEAWDYAIGMVKMAGLEPTEEFIRYIEKEKSTKIQIKLPLLENNKKKLLRKNNFQ